MNQDTIKEFVYKDCWVFIKRKNGYKYKAKIQQLDADSITIKDRLGIISIFSLDELAEISEWRDK